MNRWGTLLPNERYGRTVHQTGLPVALGGSPERLPKSSLLLIEEVQGGFLLIRYSASGEFAGDTWHQNLEETMNQAQFEFGEPVLSWAVIPPGEVDPITYIRRSLADSR